MPAPSSPDSFTVSSSVSLAALMNMPAASALRTAQTGTGGSGHRTRQGLQVDPGCPGSLQDGGGGPRPRPASSPLLLLIARMKSPASCS